MANCGEVTVERDGKLYSATYAVERGMITVQTHTATRWVDLGTSTPEALVLSVLNEIVDDGAGTSLTHRRGRR